MERDLFGIERERKIVKSRIREIFTPHQPIQSVNLFFGREKEVSRVIEVLNTPGQHSLLFGDRGVGKSSLANVSANLILEQLSGNRIIRKRCDNQDCFKTIVSDLLIEIGHDPYEEPNATQKSISIGGGNIKGVPLPKIESKSVKNKGVTTKYDSPSWVAKNTAHLKAIFIIDELDAVRDPNEKRKIAELIKFLSDEGSTLKVLLVGIAETASELTAGHPSVNRCLKETRIPRMGNEELKEIIRSGSIALDLNYGNKVISRIAKISSGYAHFTHLLALKAGEDAIAEERENITVIDLESATNKAIDDSEGTLRSIYNEAIRSATSDDYKRILLSAALCNPEEIRASELREKYEFITGKNITQGKLNNYFKRLVSETHDSILRRIAKGVYRFNDPRMPAFVKIAQTYYEE